jgi:hypothetical protein
MVATLTEQKYGVYGLSPPMVTLDSDEEIFLTTVGRAEVRVMM